MNLDDVVDEDSDEDAINLQKSEANKQGSASAAAAAMAEESKGGEEAINTTDGSGDSSDHNKSTGGSSGSGGNGSTGNLFAVGESTDKGLADMETGSEVYMSELLVSKASMHTWLDSRRTDGLASYKPNSADDLIINVFMFVYRLALIWRTSTRQRK